MAAECQTASHSGVLVPIKCNLNNEEEILSMFSLIKKQHKGVDVCINNAGLAHPESPLNGKTSGWRNMLDVNVLALSICTREAYQSMKERNIEGHIININGDDADKAAAAYSKLKPLKAADVANAVIYVLSAPPHMQIGDIQVKPVEQVL